MGDETKTSGGLPGNHGQFGTNNATEDYKPLADQDADGSTAAPEPTPESTESTENTESNPGPRQVQGGMRS